MGREGGGLYRTAEITNRAQDRVSPMISALAKNMQIVSQSFGLSVILCASERRLFASQVQNRAENCERHTHESVAGLLFFSKSSTLAAFTLIRKRIVWTPSKEN